MFFSDREAAFTNLVRALEELRRDGCFFVGLDDGGTNSVADLHVDTDPDVLVVGS